MGVAMGPFAGLPMSLKNSLDLLKGDGIDKMGVFALVLDALVGDDAHVVRIAQDVVQLVGW